MKPSASIGLVSTVVAVTAALGLGGVVWLAHQGLSPPSGIPITDGTDTPLLYAGAPPTVAVIPFDIPGDNPSQRYLARALTSDLTADLSQLSGLTLIGGSPTGIGDPTDRPPLAAASYRILGEVEHSSDHIAMHLVLIQVATGEQVWARRYDLPFAGLPQAQLQAATDLAAALSVELTPDERARLRRRHGQSAAAYDLFSRAQAGFFIRDADANRRARERYLLAIKLDPGFARAWGGLALTHAADSRNGWTDNGDASLAQARAAAETASRLDPDLPEVLWVLAYVAIQERRHDQAIGYLDRALALSPSFADAYVLKGSALIHMGAPQAAITLVHRAMRLDPGSSYLTYLVLGRALFYLDQPKQALASLREAVARNPAYLESHLYLAAAAQRAGEHDLADWEALEILSLSPGFSPEAWLASYPMSDRAQADRLLGTLAQLGLSTADGDTPRQR